MMSILTLALMVLLVATMKGTGGKRPVRPGKPATKRGDTLVLGPGVKLGHPHEEPGTPGKVSYRLMQDKKLPSSAQRAWRRIGRPFGWFTRRFSSPKVDGTATGRRTSGESVELQNFLDARNREIARRKSEDPSKRGPEDTLH